jgi:hypothetical protein
VKILNFFSIFVVVFALLDPDPSPATQINADPDPDADPDPQHFLQYPYPVPVAERRGWSESSFSIAPPDPYTSCSPACKRKKNGHVAYEDLKKPTKLENLIFWGLSFRLL